MTTTAMTTEIKPTRCSKCGVMVNYKDEFCERCKPSEQSDRAESAGHTPLPWQAANNWIMRRHPTCDVRVAVCDAYTAPKQPSDPRDRANAKLIVTAVNNQASLVAALEQTQSYLRQVVESAHSDFNVVNVSDAAAVCDTIDEVLARARE